MKRLYLVDVSNMFFRAFFALPRLNNSKGFPTGALYGFLTMTLKLLRDVKPDLLVYCFDRPEPSFRAEIYPDYKAHRPEMPEELAPQIPLVRRLTEVLGIPAMDREKYEADDLIGALTDWGRSQGYEVTIVSGDKDFAQLVGPGVSLLDTMKNRRYDVAGVSVAWGIEPSQMIDYLALVGDTSDNIPGVRGVGPKTAQKLLKEYGTLEGIYENLDKITGRSLVEKLREDRDKAFLARRLVTIARDVPLGEILEKLKMCPVQRPALEELLQELEFHTLLEKFTTPAAAASVPEPAPAPEPTPPPRSAASQGEARKVRRTAVVEEWTLGELARAIPPYSEVWAMATERGIAFAVGQRLALVRATAEEIGKVLDGRKLRWKGYDLKALWHQIELSEPGSASWDLMLAAYVVRPGEVESFDQVYREYCGASVPELADAAEYLRLADELGRVLEGKVAEQGGARVLEEIDLPLERVLFAMERQGILVDAAEFRRQSEVLAVDIRSIEKKIFLAAGTQFNVASPKQLAEILFGKMGIPPVKKTKTGYSTDSDVLQKLAGEHPICNDILEYRELAKLKSTYVDALPAMINPETGRVHTVFKQAVTSTGRLSSVQPNLQNIPIRTERGRAVRRAFVAPPGKALISADYSQIELRILAEMARDEGLMAAFNEDQDVHAATASQIFGVPLPEVTPDLRRIAKAVNFGIAYGQGPFGLADTLGIPRREATEIISQYFSRFAGVKTYMEEVVETAKKRGYVETLFGRRRYIAELQSSQQAIRRFGERAAINAPIQGTASDIVKLAMLQLFQEVPYPLLLQVHDELVFECPENEVDEAMSHIQGIMESVAKLKVPLKVNVAAGPNWDAAH